MSPSFFISSANRNDGGRGATSTPSAGAGDAVAAAADAAVDGVGDAEADAMGERTMPTMDAHPAHRSARPVQPCLERHHQPVSPRARLRHLAATG
jgi:hypothetical protein